MRDSGKYNIPQNLFMRDNEKYNIPQTLFMRDNRNATPITPCS
jgi:hypothetical protein